MIAVVDYGMGNLRSMAKALEAIGADVKVTSDADDIRAAERLVLPGVGAFGLAMQELRSTGLIGVLEEQVFERGCPLLGVCLGMQLMAEESFEHGHHEGLGWIKGAVRPLDVSPGVRVPHTGWNLLELTDAAAGTPVAQVRPHEAFYFNHSLSLQPTDPGVVAATTSHGQSVVAAVVDGPICGAQFHPEKSQQSGLGILADFVYWQPAAATA